MKIIYSRKIILLNVILATCFFISCFNQDFGSCQLADYEITPSNYNEIYFKYGATVLHQAVINMNFEELKCIVDMSIAQSNHAEFPIDMNAVDAFGMSPLLMAVDQGLLEVVKILTSNKVMEANIIDININDWQKKTPLDIAKEKDFQQIVEYLKVIGAVINEPLDPDTTDTEDKSCKVGNYFVNIDNFNDFLFARIDTPMLRAMRQSWSKESTCLLELLQSSNSKGIDLNIQSKYDNKTMLHFAIEKGYTPLLQYLLTDNKIMNSEIDLKIKDSQGRTPLHIAIQNKHNAVIRGLLLGNLTENPKNEGDGKYVKEGFINLNLQDSYGKTALHYMLELNNQDENLQLILNRDFVLDGHIDLNIRDQEQEIPIGIAIRKRSISYLSMLTKHEWVMNDKINLNIPINFQGRNPLGSLVFDDVMKMANILLDEEFIKERKIDLNTLDKAEKQGTILHVMTKHQKENTLLGKILSVKNLANAWADPFIQDSDGNNVLHLSVLYENYPMLNHMLEMISSYHKYPYEFNNKIASGRSKFNPNNGLEVLNNDKYHILHLALKEKNKKMLDSILFYKHVKDKLMAHKGEKAKTPIFYAVDFKYEIGFNQLVEAGSDLNHKAKAKDAGDADENLLIYVRNKYCIIPEAARKDAYKEESEMYHRMIDKLIENNIIWEEKHKKCPTTS